MKFRIFKISSYLLSLILLFTCSKEDSQDSNISISKIVDQENVISESCISNDCITVNIIAGEGGNVSVKGGKYLIGSKIKSVATPIDGYEFAYWRTNYPNFSYVSESSNLDIFLNDKIINDNQTSLSLTAIFIPEIDEFFLSKSPVYDYPNNTVGQILNTYYYPGFYLTPELINKKIINPNLPWIYNSRVAGSRESVFFDFDNNNKLDLFGFMSPSAYPNSKYFDSGITEVLEDFQINYMNGGEMYLVKDFFSDNPITYIYESNVSFPSGTEVNDFNGDGMNDLLWYYSNDHEIRDSNQSIYYGENLPLEIYYFSSDGNYNITPITLPASIHDLASGDIDNDGDIDIIFGTYKQNIILEDLENGFPYILLNDGSGNFTIQNSYERFLGLEELFEEYNCPVCAIMNLITIELFDINNDGVLDLFVGNNFNNFETHLFNPEKPRFYLGMGNGYFDLNNFIEIPLIDFSSSNPLTINGVTFIDAQNDGFYDIIINANGNNQNAYQFIQNNNLIFENVTIDKFNSFYEERTQSFCEDCLPGFYQFRAYDKDNDGDFDLVPSNLRIIWQYFGENILDTPNNIYWENIGGQFIKKIN